MDLTSLPGIGDKTAAALERVEITSFRELVETYPRTYRSYQATTTKDAQVGDYVVLKGHLTRPISKRGARVTSQLSTFQDHAGRLQLRWFNMPYITKSTSPSSTYLVKGKVEEFRGVKQIVSPQLTTIADDHKLESQLIPIYSSKGSLKPWVFRQKIKSLLNHPELPPDPLPSQIVSRYQLIPYSAALKKIHQPNSLSEVESARYRLSFQELYLLQLDAIQKNTIPKSPKDKQIKLDSTSLSSFTSSLPFTLTKSQSLAIEEIMADLSSKGSMQRLLAGEVGSGKTAVAAAAAYLVANSKKQVLVMAPTVILAGQLFESLSSFLNPLELTTSLVSAKNTGNLDADIIVGTQALLGKELKNIGLTIIDEQHRFGVKQREQLRRLSSHTLLMTATPIPRTLARTLFGHLEITRLTELPSGRLPIKTYLVPEHKRDDSYLWLKQLIRDGNQAFIVTPLIEEAEEQDENPLKSVNELKKSLAKRFPTLSIDYLHGKLKEKDKLDKLNSFKEGHTQLLVATSMIEVGIDIPAANLMIIEDADRFGLAQLHQLRGRVGRGQAQGYCLLFTSSKTIRAKERLSYFTRTTDGEKLALYDLEDRGPGELFGVEQHGYFNLKLANIYDEDLLKITHEAAKSTLKLDK